MVDWAARRSAGRAGRASPITASSVGLSGTLPSSGPMAAFGRANRRVPVVRRDPGQGRTACCGARPAGAAPRRFDRCCADRPRDRLTCAAAAGCQSASKHPVLVSRRAAGSVGNLGPVVDDAQRGRRRDGAVVRPWPPSGVSRSRTCAVSTGPAGSQKSCEQAPMLDNHLRRDSENGGGVHSQNCAYFPSNGASRQAMAWRPKASLPGVNYPELLYDALHPQLTLLGGGTGEDGGHDSFSCLTRWGSVTTRNGWACCCTSRARCRCCWRWAGPAGCW